MVPSMNDQPPRPLFPHFCQLPYSLRSLYTATLLLLGLGYLFALANLYFTYAGKAGGNPLMVSYEDIVVTYAGSDKVSAIEDALNGPMSPMLPPEEKHALIKWARAGAAQSRTRATSSLLSTSGAWLAMMAVTRSFPTFSVMTASRRSPKATEANRCRR